MADDEWLDRLTRVLREAGDAAAWLEGPELKDTRDNVLAELHRLGLDLAPGDFRVKAAPLVDAIEDLGVKAGIIEDRQEQGVYYRNRLAPEKPGSGLSTKDVLLLILVALMLMHGGDSHPTALGEAIESNDLQVVAILIALAAYLKKS